MTGEGFTRFNTVNGKHCCNLVDAALDELKMIPISFNTVNGKHCCNLLNGAGETFSGKSFNTVNGKHCCN